MERTDELKEMDFKSRIYYQFDDTMAVIDIGFSDILLNEKSYENISIFDISYTTFMGAKPLRIWFKRYIDLLKFMM